MSIQYRILVGAADAGPSKKGDSYGACLKQRTT